MGIRRVISDVHPRKNVTDRNGTAELLGAACFKTLLYERCTALRNWGAVR
jgi:hypothetical protein